MRNLIEEGELGEAAIKRAYNNFLINLLVTFKHICQNKKFDFKSKYKEIKDICSAIEIQNIINESTWADSIQLRLLRLSIKYHLYICIYFMITFRYIYMR